MKTAEQIRNMMPLADIEAIIADMMKTIEEFALKGQKYVYFPTILGENITKLSPNDKKIIFKKFRDNGFLIDYIPGDYRDSPMIKVSWEA